ncbi:peptidoglycan-binding protein LysM [Geotalea uraniireducens]|uniref:Peptidoglycan-binding protein LysM n=1 Tax=Geotalea uraniireducens TaxID=351604 RepID=A0ABM8EG19_9BACT|nr:LysM peptidoglycan-binding domain-containing protein [Geotalea uraniireducens]BDV41340.1 peptidoglycan-binding protein LysM [Geotalea uraniireducens]
MIKRPTTFASTLLLTGIIAVSAGTNSFCASSQFELDLQELQNAPPTARHQKRSATRPASHVKKELPPADEEGYSRYTIKPGDFLFKVLIRDFGLSNNAAEALLPEIQRINHLADIKRLEVGQTILIPRRQPKVKTPVSQLNASEPSPPASNKSAAAALQPEPPRHVQAPAEPPPPPKQVLTLPPGPSTAPPAAPAPPSQAKEEQPSTSVQLPSFASRLITAWTELVPGQGEIRPISLNGKTLPADRFPLLLAADGGRILVDLSGALSAQEKALLAVNYPDTRVVVRGKESVKDFFATLLHTAEFARVDNNVTVDFGSDPRLTVYFDFRVTTLPAATRGPEAVYLCIDENVPAMPQPLQDYLASNGYRVVEFDAGAAKAATDPGYDLQTIPQGAPCETTAALLDALSIRLEKNRIVSGSLSDSRFSIRVEGFFENGGKRFILSCDDSDSYNYTLLRLLQLDGYTIIHFAANSTYGTTIDTVLTALDYPHTQGTLQFPYGRYSITLTGFKVTRKVPSPGRLLITSQPAEPLFAELLKWSPDKP